MLVTAVVEWMRMCAVWLRRSTECNWWIQCIHFVCIVSHHPTEWAIREKKLSRRLHFFRIDFSTKFAQFCLSYGLVSSHFWYRRNELTNKITPWTMCQRLVFVVVVVSPSNHFNLLFVASWTIRNYCSLNLKCHIASRQQQPSLPWP